jgi:ATP-dependent DNA helicase RecG
LISLDAALRTVHFPESDAALKAARRRLAFEELFLLQTVLELRRRMLNEAGRGLSTAGPGDLARRAESLLPFVLTPDQAAAIAEIAADLAAPRPMQRLLLGDVGSGKTVVAYLAALHVIEAGHQAAFMAPTEILARQHGTVLAQLAAAVEVRVEVLTGSTPPDERRRITAALDAGTPMLAVGTHALLEDKVKIPRLALAIVDEQHRFGVRQRALLAKKSVMPDVLVLTATPIPRTLMLASYGDLDVSRLRTRPAGRGRIVTRVATEEKFSQIIEFMARELISGRQAFVVVPLIEEGEPQGTLNISTRGHRAAQAEFRQLSEHPLLRNFSIGLLHGRLKPAEKQRVMEAFAGGTLHVLVATTVVEVGIDVPNATLMMIENADRFGLTQLHQLRGRVGRGVHRSVCVLIPGPGATPEARGRLQVLTRTEDGFEIAEADLALRGPGELWGVRQSGLPRLRMADLARDAALLDEAHTAARSVVARDAWLAQDEHAILKQRLMRDYREPLELALAG